MNKSLLMGAVGAIIAIALISAAILTPGVLGVTTGTSSVSTSSQSTVVGSTTGTSQVQTNTGPSGTLAVLMTDPPTIPDGVTAVYINYSDISIHVSNAGNETGWTDLQSSGEINLLSIINSTETIAASNVTSGVFNALRFNITSALVTFQGTNYTADLVYQEHTLFVPIVGGITITGGKTSAAVIEMTPTVLLLGNTTDPVFAFIPGAKGYTLSAQSISPNPHKGDRDDDNGKISDQIQDQTHFEITAASLTPNSLSVTVKNNGNTPIVFRFVALTATSTISGGWVPTAPMGSISKISEFFVVASNGSLLSLNSKSHQQLDTTMDAGGNSMAAGSSVTYTYNGPVTMGALALLQGQTPTQSVSPGQRYVVTVLGGGAFAKTLVTASTSPTTSTSTQIATSTVTATATTTITPTSNHIIDYKQWYININFNIDDYNHDNYIDHHFGNNYIDYLLNYDNIAVIDYKFFDNDHNFAFKHNQLLDNNDISIVEHDQFYNHINDNCWLENSQSGSVPTPFPFLLNQKTMTIVC